MDTGTPGGDYWVIENGDDRLQFQFNGFDTGKLTTGGVWASGSSRGYKENIRELEAADAIEALEQLRPVVFNYKAEKDETYVGFIAEDVPQLVAMNDRKTLSPMDFIGVLTKVVQVQQREIQGLKALLNQRGGDR